MPTPMLFERQPVPFLIETPSELQSGGPVVAEVSDESYGFHAAIRGTVTHRVVESLWHRGELPHLDRIETALAAAGLNPQDAAVLAQEIESEVKACQKEAFFAWLLDRTASGRSEMTVEALKQPGVVQTGVLDFVRKDQKQWWIVDFKTSRPKEGEKETEFLEHEADHYRAQLMAYRDMLAKTIAIDPTEIKSGLYFTGLQRWHEPT